MSSHSNDRDKKPLIQEVEHSGVEIDSREGDSEGSDTDSSSTSSSSEGREDHVKYGFMDKHSGLLSKAYIEEHPDVFEYVGSLNNMDSLQRRVNRISAEDDKFDHLRFMGDFYGILEDDVYTEAISVRAGVDQRVEFVERRYTSIRGRLLISGRRWRGTPRRKRQ